MKRFLKVLPLLAAVAFLASCKNDDNSATPTPPRDYAVQYVTEKAAIEDYLATHYIDEISADMDVTFGEIVAGDGEVALKDRTDILRSKIVTKNDIDYTVYYLVLREGVGNAPTRADNIYPAYTGTLLNGTVFDTRPFPTEYWDLSTLIEGFQEVIPEFKSGVLTTSDPSNPPVYTDFGAGVMFIPSALAYYNNSAGVAPAYSTMIFSFKLYDVKYTDGDGDGIQSRYERILDPLDPNADVADLDTDGDGIPNYKDTDDDGDGFLTKDEIGYTTGDPVIDYNTIQDCAGGVDGTKKHLDKNCH